MPEELIETITHLISDALWSNAIATIAGAKEMFEKRGAAHPTVRRAPGLCQIVIY